MVESGGDSRRDREWWWDDHRGRDRQARTALLPCTCLSLTTRQVRKRQLNRVGEAITRLHVNAEPRHYMRPRLESRQIDLTGWHRRVCECVWPLVIPHVT